jgi:hypothetical protein
MVHYRLSHREFDQVISTLARYQPSAISCPAFLVRFRCAKSMARDYYAG